MLVRIAVALAAAAAVSVPAFAEPLNAEAARHFVAGKLFSFTCFEGTTGTGRIFNDGSVAGVVKMQGTGNTRFMHLPPGTLYAKNNGICSNVKGAFFNPCFDLAKTSDKSFRGTISGFGFAYCDFVRRGGGRETIQASMMPDLKAAIARTSIRHTRKSQQQAAAQKEPAAAQPVTAAPVAPVERAEIRSTISP